MSDMWKFVILGLILVAYAVLLAGGRSPIICLHYPTWVGEEPLPRAEEIVSRDESSLTLTNGMVVRLEEKVKFLEHHQRAKLSVGDMVSVEEVPGVLFSRVEVFRCGTPYAALISIPIFEDRSYRYKVRSLCRITVETNNIGQAWP